MFDPKLVKEYLATGRKREPGEREYGRMFARDPFGTETDYGAQREADSDRDSREARLAYVAGWLRDHGFKNPARTLLIAGAVVDGGAMPALSVSERDTVSQVPVGNSASATNTSQRDGTGGAYKPKQPSGRAPVAGLPDTSRPFSRTDTDAEIASLRRDLDSYHGYAVARALSRGGK